jgi:hypothetical protein
VSHSEPQQPVPEISDPNSVDILKQKLAEITALIESSKFKAHTKRREIESSINTLHSLATLQPFRKTSLKHKQFQLQKMEASKKTQDGQ